MILGRIHSLYKVSLLGMDNVDSRARRGKVRSEPVALHVTLRRCFVETSLKSSTSSRYRIWGLQGIAVCWISAIDRAAGRSLVNSIASVF